MPKLEIPKHDFYHFRSLEQHADGTKRLAKYDFLLVFYSDLRSSLELSMGFVDLRVELGCF